MNASVAPLLATALLLGGAAQAAEVTWVGTRLQPRESLRQGDRFGATLAVGPGLIAVGAYLADANGTDSGAIYFFQKSVTGWNPVQTMTQEGSPGDQLGFDLAFDKDGTTLLAGAPFARRDGVRCGAAFRFSLNVQERKVTSKELVSLPGDSCQEGAEIGSAVAIGGQVVAVGARGFDHRRGRVHATFNGQGLRALEADVRDGDELGTSLATNGTLLVAGAPFADNQATDSGVVIIFSDSAQRGVSLALANGQARAAFGYSVALRNDNLAVAAPLEDAAAGAVHRFEREAGTWTERLPAFRGPERGAQLGVSIAWADSTLFAGARRAGGRGAVYGFGDGSPVISSPNPEANAEFGFAVAAQSSVLAVGAFLQDGLGVDPIADTGAAYVFEPDTEPEVMIELGPLESCVFEKETLPLSVTVRTKDSRPLTAQKTLRLQTCPDLGACTAKPDDFTRPVDEMRTINAGISSITLEFPSLTIKDDSQAEPPETLVVRATLDDKVDEKSSTIHDSPFLLPQGPLTVAEGGAAATFEVALACPPVKPVRVTLRSEPAEAVVSPSSLRFTPSNWKLPRTVEVTAVDDPVCDPPKPFEVVVTGMSQDRRYGGRTQRILASKTGNDPLLAASQSVCAYADNTVIYTIRLSNPCTFDQTLDFEDRLPPEVSIVTASADNGAAWADYLANSALWRGFLPAGEEAKITVVTGLDPVAPGTPVENPCCGEPSPLPPLAFPAGDVDCFSPP